MNSWNIKNSLLNHWKVPVPVRVQQCESSQYRDLVLRGQKVNILIRVIKENDTLFDSRWIIEISIEWPAELPAESFPSRRISKFTVQA